MRVAFVLSLFPTLSETFILNQITGLFDRGHQVDIYAQCRENGSKTHGDVLKYKLLDRTYYRISIPTNLCKRFLKALWFILINLHKRPLIILRSLNFFKYGRKAISLRLLYEALPYLNSESYDIIHCHFGPSGLIGIQMRDIGAIKGKLITSFYGYDVNVLPNIYGTNYYKDLFEVVDLCTVCSDFLRNRTKALGADERKLVKLPVGVDFHKFLYRNRKAYAGCSIKILTVARLVEVKGVEYSIKAMAKNVPKFPNVEYWIAGDGPLRPQLQQLINQLGIQENVKLLGPQTNEEILNLYSQAHIFVLSGIVGQDGAEEAQGTVLLEAQAAGLPVVASRVGGIPESVLDGKSSFLVPEKDVDALAERLSYLIQHPEVWPKMGQAGRAFVEANYDINKLNDRLVEIYQESVENGRCR